jgi:hypothetical protein
VTDTCSFVQGHFTGSSNRTVVPSLRWESTINSPPRAEARRAMLRKPWPSLSDISIDGEEHPIQLNNPIVLQMGNRERRIVLRSAP